MHLSRKQKEKQKLLEIENHSDDDDEHLQAIIDFRKRKAGLVEERKGWGYWLSLGCVRSKSTAHLNHAGPAALDDTDQGGKAAEETPNLKLSPIKGVRLSKDSQTTPQTR